MDGCPASERPLLGLNMELQLNTIVDSLDDSIITVAEDLRVVFLNEAAAKTFGCDREEVLRQSIAQFPLLAEALGQIKFAELHLTAESPKAVRRLQGRRADGDFFPMEALITGMHVGGRKCYTAVIRDISLQQQMEKAVYKARKNQAIGSLAGGIAHDFNNILTAIISQIDLALYARELPPSLKENLVYAKASARRAAELVSKLQLFSGQAESKFAPLDLAGVVEQVVFMLRRSIDPRIQISYAEPGVGTWFSDADASQILQVLMNLGLNARDAMPEGGQLVFVVERAAFQAAGAAPPRKAGDFVRISVGDTGQGIPPETLNRVFDPYFTTRDLSQRSGLGLSIAQTVVAEHGGWMEVESRQGQGSCFSVFLPLSRQTQSAIEPRPLPILDTKAMEGTERILIADDEELVRIVMRAILNYRGYQIVEALDGEDAVEKYLQSSKPFDLVLMDLHMPRLNGLDALARIRKHNPKVKAVMLSGGFQEKDTERSIEIEGVKFLQKPFENQDLVCLVREMIDA